MSGTITPSLIVIVRGDRRDLYAELRQTFEGHPVVKVIIVVEAQAFQASGRSVMACRDKARRLPGGNRATGHGGSTSRGTSPRANARP